MIFKNNEYGKNGMYISGVCQFTVQKLQNVQKLQIILFKIFMLF